MTTIAENPTENPTEYLNQRIADAGRRRQAEEAEAEQRRQAEREERRATAIARLRDYLEDALDEPLRVALGLTYDAESHEGTDYDWRPTASFTLQPEGAELRLAFATGGVARLFDPAARHFSESDLSYVYPQDGAQNLLAGIAIYRERVAERQQREAQREAEAAAATQREAERRAALQVAQAARAAARQSESQAESQAATPAPTARIIADDHYERVIELALTHNDVKVVTLHRNGPVQLLEMTPYWATDENGRSTAEHFTLSQAEMALLVAAYTAYETEHETEVTGEQAAAGDATDDEFDDQPF